MYTDPRAVEFVPAKLGMKTEPPVMNKRMSWLSGSVWALATLGGVWIALAMVSQ